mmetsp:Transcript_30336/g.29673  ORF Transcript_30336/g.29673 Transcript_30336/m.29673 type:complete len:103 (+) Transcript_30336:417-725(+)
MTFSINYNLELDYDFPIVIKGNRVVNLPIIKSFLWMFSSMENLEVVFEDNIFEQVEVQTKFNKGLIEMTTSNNNLTIINNTFKHSTIDSIFSISNLNFVEIN